MAIPLILWLFFSPFFVTYQLPSQIGVEKNPKIRAALKYHGTLDVYEIAHGKWRFMRNGVECKLFTVAFEKNYGG